MAAQQVSARIVSSGWIHSAVKHESFSGETGQVTAMQSTFTRIIEDGGIHGVEGDIVSVDEIFRLQDMAGIKALEKKYLR